MRNRALFACLVLVTGLSALSVRLLYIQSWERKFSEKSQISRFKMKVILPAARGRIVDRHRQVLAQNRPEATLIADANHLRHEDNLTSAVAHRHATQQEGWRHLSEEEQEKEFYKWKSLVRRKMTPQQVRDEHLDYALEIISRELRVPSEELLEIIEKGKTRIVVREKIREDQARRIEFELGSRYIQGFLFERAQPRSYPLEGFAAHIIGFVNYEGVGQAGIERVMEEYLKGRPGLRQLKRDPNGLVRLTESASVRPPILGKHVQLTLHVGIQAIAEEELQKAMELHQAKRGCVIILEPHTGDIYAMASRPHYDPNIRLNYEEGGLNFAVQEQYEAGSVMKVIAMAAALERGVADRQTVVDCGGTSVKRSQVEINNPYYHGELTFDEVMLKSSNPGVFLFAEKVGSVGFYETLDQFGFGERTGFPLPREASGRISDRENKQNFASATYGYGVSVTPLQVAMAYGAIANGGVLMQPRLIQSVIANNGIVVEQRDPVAVRRVLSKEVAREMRLSLEQVVASPRGTGRRSSMPGHRSGGKTGTAWLYSAELKDYDRSRFVTSFAGMVPVDDPQFVALVVLEDPISDDPEFAIGGGTVAAPLFKNIAERVVDLLSIEPTEPIELQSSEVAANE